MSSRSEYFLSLTGEFSAMSLFHFIATGLSLFVFVSVVALMIIRSPERDRASSHLPLED